MGEIMPLRLLKRERVDAKASAFFVRIRIVADSPRVNGNCECSIFGKIECSVFRNSSTSFSVTMMQHFL